MAELEERNARLAKLKEQGELDKDEQIELEDHEYRIPLIERDLKDYLSEERIAELVKKEEEQEQSRQQQDKKIREKAAQEAKTLVPPSLTVAGMGITGSFFIELTAVLTIIFGIILLGLVGVLGTQEIATILAAIAGYVLGKTSTSTQTSQPSSSPTSILEPPSEPKSKPPQN
jgi:hypothetical protein